MVPLAYFVAPTHRCLLQSPFYKFGLGAATNNRPRRVPVIPSRQGRERLGGGGGSAGTNPKPARRQPAAHRSHCCAQRARGAEWVGAAQGSENLSLAQPPATIGDTVRAHGSHRTRTKLDTASAAFILKRECLGFPARQKRNKLGIARQRHSEGDFHRCKLSRGKISRLGR